MKESFNETRALDPFWDKSYGRITHTFGTVEQDGALWRPEGPIFYKFHLTRTQAGNHLVIEARTRTLGELPNEYCVLKTRACRKLAETLGPDEDIFLNGILRQERETVPAETVEDTLFNRALRWLRERYRFQVIRDFGDLDERLIKISLSLKKEGSGNRSVRAYAGRWHGKILFVLKAKGPVDDTEAHWYPFGTPARKMLREALAKMDL